MTIDLEYEHHNQLILFLENSFSRLVFTFFTFSFFILHYVLRPLKIPYLFCTYSLRQFRMITKIVCDELYKLFSLFKLSLELAVNLLKTQKSLLFSSEDVERYRQGNLNVYSKIKEILCQLNILPLSPREGIISFLILQKIPSFVWEYMLPYPTFIYEDTFLNAIISEKKITVTLPATLPMMTRVLGEKDNEILVLPAPTQEYISGLKCAQEGMKN